MKNLFYPVLLLSAALYADANAQCSIYNSSFETWNTQDFYNKQAQVILSYDLTGSIQTKMYLGVEDTKSINNFASTWDASEIDSLSIFKSTDRHSGNYALGVKVNPGSATVDPGGSVYFTDACSSAPKYFNGYYKFTGVADDFAAFDVQFSKQSVETNYPAGQVILPVNNKWQSFSIKLSDLVGNQQPDAFVLAFGIVNDVNLAKSSAVLLVDDLSFSNTALSQNQLSSGPFVMFPNPAQGVVTFDVPFQNSTVTIFDISGRAVYTNSFNQGKNIIDLSNLDKGIYMVQVSSDRELVANTLVLQ